MPSLSPLSESSGSLTANTEGSKSLTVASEATENATLLPEIVYATQFVYPGQFSPAASVTSSNYYPGQYGDFVGILPIALSEGTKTLTPLAEV